MIERVISGGQTGADQAGWRAAKVAGIATGGWMPKGFLTEVGPRPEFADLYGAREHLSPSYSVRRLANILDAQETIVFARNPASPGTRATLFELVDHDRAGLLVSIDGTWQSGWPPQATANWLRQRDIRSVNIAGNRESKAPGIGEWVERYLAEVFRLMVP
jgi:hypothetical protein